MIKILNLKRKMKLLKKILKIRVLRILRILKIKMQKKSDDVDTSKDFADVDFENDDTE